MEFFNLVDTYSNNSMIGKTKFHCGVNINWSSDSKYLVVAVLSPRLRVDNEYKVIYQFLLNKLNLLTYINLKIFTFNGTVVEKENFDTEVYDVNWINSILEYSEYKIDKSEGLIKYLDDLKKNPKKETETFQSRMEEKMKKSNPGIPGMTNKKKKQL